MQTPSVCDVKLHKLWAAQLHSYTLGGGMWLDWDVTQAPAGRGGTPSCLLLTFASKILVLTFLLKVISHFVSHFYN